MSPHRLWIGFFAVLFVLACGHRPVDADLVITPQIGLNASYLTSDPDIGDNKGFRAGWQVGGYLRLGQEDLYLQPGIFWYRVSTELETTETIEGKRVFENTIDSIQIPLLLGWHPINGGVFNLRLQGGGGANVSTGVSENTVITKDDLSDLTWLLKFAVGVDVGIFTVDLGYDKGLTDYFESDSENTGEMDSIFFNLGLRFWI